MKYNKNNTFLHKNGPYMPKLNCYVNQKGHLFEGNFWVLSIITIVKFLKKMYCTCEYLIDLIDQA